MINLIDSLWIMAGCAAAIGFACFICVLLFSEIPAPKRGYIALGLLVGWWVVGLWFLGVVMFGDNRRRKV